MKTSNTTTFDPIPDFLNDAEGIGMLESMILVKHEDLLRVEQEEKNFLASNAYPELEEIRPYFLQKVAELKFGKEKSQIQKELDNMCHWFWKVSNKDKRDITKLSQWQNQYEYATTQVRIEDVVPQFIDMPNIRRNIKCPFHADKSPSFKIYPKSNKFICFGCGVRGSPIDFIMKLKGYDFKEAIAFLNNS